MKPIILSLILTFLAWESSAQRYDKEHFEIAADYQLENYTVPVVSNWHLASLSATIGLGHIVLQPQISYGSRIFADNDAKQGVAAQLDLYPKFSKTVYMLVSYGYSASEIFPRQKAAAEVYISLGKGWEVSSGGRYLFFPANTGSHIITYTLGGAKYAGRYLITLKGMLTDQSTNNELSPSGSLSVRRFFANEYDYMQFNINYGISAEDVTYFQTGASLTNLANSFSASFAIKKSVSKHIVITGGISYRYENYQDRFSRNVFGFSVGTAYRF